MEDTRICAICGQVKPIGDFGDGLKIPKTTCLECWQRNYEELHKRLQATPHLADLVEKALKPIIDFGDRLKTEALKKENPT